MEELFNGEKMDMSYIKVIAGRWTLNGKNFNEMTLNEGATLAEHIKSY